MAVAPSPGFLKQSSVNWRSARLWAGLAISAATVFLLVKGITWEEVVSTLRHIQVSYMILALLIVLVTTAAKVERWRLLFWPKSHQIGWIRLFGIILAGQMINFAFPGRMGDVARIFYVSQEKRIRRAHVVTTIGVEKMLDLIMTLALLVLLLPFMSVPLWLQDSTHGLLIVTLLLIVVLGTLTWQGHRLLPWFIRLLGLLPQRFRSLAQGQLEHAMEGLGVLRQGRMVAGIAGWSLVVWVTSVATNYLVFRSLNLNLSWQAALFLLLVLMLGSAVPSSPGKVGVFHYLTVLALSPFAVSKPIAFSVSLVLYGVVYIPPIVIGSIFMILQKPSVGKARTGVPA